MTDINEAYCPKDERGNDPNDWRNTPGYIDRLMGSEEPIHDEQEDKLILTPVCVADWQDKPIPARQWAWDTWLPKGTVAGLGGAPGVAKSLFAQQICTHKALGGQFLDCDMPIGAALYITCEDELDELMRRQARINAALNIKMNDIPNLYLDSWMGETAQLVIINKGIFCRTPRFEALDDLIGKLKPEIVALDLLADMWNGNECDRQAVNGFIKAQLAYLAQRHNATILGLYHPSLSGMASGTGTSGSTAWEGSFRSRLYLQTDEGTDTRILTRPKSNYAANDDEHRLVWKDGYLVPESSSGKSEIDKLKEKWGTAFLECLQACEAKNKEISPSYNSPNFYGTVFPDTWIMIDGRHKAITKEQFKKAFTRLEFDGAITVLPKNNDGGKRVKFIGYK